MNLRNLSSNLQRPPAFKFDIGQRVRTSCGNGKIEKREIGAGSRLPLYAVRLDRPFELRNGTSIERSAFFELELDRVAA